jgi:predicted RNase H-like HicB family nuclease
MATATDTSKLRKLEDADKEHRKTSSKLKAYATGAMNVVPFLNQSGISYPGPKEYEAQGRDIEDAIKQEREAISKGKRDYMYKEGNKLPEGMVEKMAKGGEVKGWGKARGARKAKMY